MKKKISILLTSMVLMFLTSSSFAQNDKKAVASPPAKATAKIGSANVSISYSQPSVKGRKIWGDLVPFAKVWRTGANNATVFETDKDLKIEGKTLKAGKYALFSIPTEKEWTIIFNKKSDQWGAYDYSDKEDVLRVNVKSEATKDMTERLTFDIKNGKVNLMWEKLMVSFKVE
jgi:Protein of unknown function (DUF2911)